MCEIRMTSTCLFRVDKDRGKVLGVQDVYTRLLSTNLDFDSELQHVFCWAPDECPDSRVFHVDRVFSVFEERCSRVWLGCVERYTWLAVLTRTHVFWLRYVVLLDPAETLVSLVLLLSGRQRWTSAEHVALSISVFCCLLFTLPCLSQCFWNDTEKISMSLRKC